MNAGIDFTTVFQSAPPHGERPQLADNDIMVIEFQSAPPHGERPQPMR